MCGPTGEGPQLGCSSDLLAMTSGRDTPLGTLGRETACWGGCQLLRPESPQPHLHVKSQIPHIPKAMQSPMVPNYRSCRNSQDIPPHGFQRTRARSQCARLLPDSTDLPSKLLPQEGPRSLCDREHPYPWGGEGILGNHPAGFPLDGCFSTPTGSAHISLASQSGHSHFYSGGQKEQPEDPWATSPG